MSYEHQQNRPSPPPVYSEDAPGGMENELYIDGTLYVDGVAVNRDEQRGRSGRHSKRQENPCEKILIFVRSNFNFLEVFL
jgi:hypothetical protein